MNALALPSRRILSLFRFSFLFVARSISNDSNGIRRIRKISSLSSSPLKFVCEYMCICIHVCVYKANNKDSGKGSKRKIGVEIRRFILGASEWRGKEISRVLAQTNLSRYPDVFWSLAQQVTTVRFPIRIVLARHFRGINAHFSLALLIIQ